MRGHPIREFFPRLRRPVGWHQIVAASALWVATTVPSSAQEFRAAWADVFHVGMGSQTEVNNMVSALVAGRYNAVVVQVLAYMDNSPASHGAHWKSAIVPCQSADQSACKLPSTRSSLWTARAAYWANQPRTTLAGVRAIRKTTKKAKLAKVHCHLPPSDSGLNSADGSGTWYAPTKTASGTR